MLPNTALHEQRLETVLSYLLHARVATVLDLGCGSAPLIERLLVEPSIERVVGIDRSAEALRTARRRFLSGGAMERGRLSLRQACITRLPGDLGDFDAHVLVEVIEHIHPSRLSALEQMVFSRLRPRHVVITTPNREYNTLHGLRTSEYRHPDHRFEWDRDRFARWATGVARRNRYAVALEGIGPGNAWFGSSSQMATFRQLSE